MAELGARQPRGKYSDFGLVCLIYKGNSENIFKLHTHCLLVVGAGGALP